MTPKQFAQSQGLRKRIEEDWNAYIIYSLMNDYAEHYHEQQVKTSNDKRSVSVGKEKSCSHSFIIEEGRRICKKCRL